MKSVITILWIFILNSCTYNVSMVHSEGSTDTMDETQTASPTVSPNVNIPVNTGLPSITPTTK
jgi:hypothetical protein